MEQGVKGVLSLLLQASSLDFRPVVHSLLRIEQTEGGKTHRVVSFYQAG